MNNIFNQAQAAARELVEKSEVKSGNIVVIGCSTSEVIGKKIGTSGTLETANELFSVLYEETKKKIDVFEDETGVLNINAPFTFNLKVTTNKANELTMAQKEYIKNFMADKIKSEIMAVLYESKRLESDFLKLYSSYQTHSRSRFYELDWEKMIASMNIDASVFINKIQNDTVR